MKVLLAFYCMIGSLIAFAQQEEILVLVHSKDHVFINVPVSLPLEKLPHCDWNNLVLYQKEDQSYRIHPHQYHQGRQAGITFLIEGRMEKNEVKEFVLRSEERNISFSPIKILINEESYTVTDGNRKIFAYQHREQMPPSGVDPIYSRSAFIHPLWSPSQSVLTRIQPEDHYHHYGIWNPWTKTIFGGEEIDFWNLGKKQGTVRFKGLISRVEGPVYGEIHVLQDHIKLGDGKTEETILHEAWMLRAWKLNRDKGYWLIDFTSILNCATTNPMELKAYRYGGGIGFRAAEQWTHKNTSVLTSRGKTRDEADGSRARWCMVSADIQDGSNEPGILFMSHSLNRDHPEPMRVWPSDANEGRGDLFFEFCPIRHKDWILEPGREYALNYRLLVFDIPINPEEAELYWNSFVNSPEIEIIIK